MLQPHHCAGADGSSAKALAAGLRGEALFRSCSDRSHGSPLADGTWSKAAAAGAQQTKDSGHHQRPQLCHLRLKQSARFLEAV